MKLSTPTANSQLQTKGAARGQAENFTVKHYAGEVILNTFIFPSSSFRKESDDLFEQIDTSNTCSGCLFDILFLL